MSQFSRPKTRLKTGAASFGKKSNKVRKLEQTLTRLTTQLGPKPELQLSLSMSRPEVIKADMTALRLYYRQLLKNQKLASKLEKQILGKSGSTKSNGPIYALLQVYKHINEVIDATQSLRTSEEKHSLLVNRVINPIFDQLIHTLARICKKQKDVLELTTELQTLYDKSVDVTKTLAEDEL